MLNQNFVILGAIIGMVGGLKYVVDTIKGKVKPNRVSWFLWFIAPLIAFFAEVRQGVGIQSLMTFIVGFEPFVVFVASFVNKKSVWKISRFDIVCGAFSVLGIILWYITKVPDVAIVFSIVADGFASLPTIAKSYTHPETENIWTYLATSINAVITLLTINIWNLANYAFPIYIFIVNLIVFVLVKFKLGQIISTTRKK
jgi:hypothetical protein